MEWPPLAFTSVSSLYRIDSYNMVAGCHIPFHCGDLHVLASSRKPLPSKKSSCFQWCWGLSFVQATMARHWSCSPQSSASPTPIDGLVLHPVVEWSFVRTNKPSQHSALVESAFVMQGTMTRVAKVYTSNGISSVGRLRSYWPVDYLPSPGTRYCEVILSYTMTRSSSCEKGVSIACLL